MGRVARFTRNALPLIVLVLSLTVFLAILRLVGAFDSWWWLLGPAVLFVAMVLATRLARLLGRRTDIIPDEAALDRPPHRAGGAAPRADGAEEG